jgi:hypothetical protein
VRRWVLIFVITSEVRNLLLLALEKFVQMKQQIPHGLKAVRDDNSESPFTARLKPSPFKTKTR